MPKIIENRFRAIIKKVSCKALVSGDKSYQAIFQGEDKMIALLIGAPADKEVEVTVKYL